MDETKQLLKEHLENALSNMRYWQARALAAEYLLRQAKEKDNVNRGNKTVDSTNEETVRSTSTIRSKGK